MTRDRILTAHSTPSTPLILASSSPRRRELLAAAGYSFTVLPPSDWAESGGIASGETPAQFVARLARQKAADVAPRVERGIVVACDTVAECGGQILGKPANRAQARQMLELLRGRPHHVYSGLCLWLRPDDNHQTEVAATRLTMDPISDQDLANYLATDLWEGKAGAFGYQDGLDWVHVVEGSESNVVGLPMELLSRMITECTSGP